MTKHFLLPATMLISFGWHAQQSPGGVSDGLLVWLKADAGTSTTEDGSGVSVWSDQSGRGNHAVQSDVSRQLNYVQSSINGNPALRMNGGSRFMKLNYSGIGSSEYTMVSVIRRANGNSGQYWLGGANTTTNPSIRLGYSSSTVLKMNHGSTYAVRSVPNFNSTGEPAVIVVNDYSAAAGRYLYQYINEQKLSAAGTSGPPLTQNAVGYLGRGWGSTGMSGDIAELIIFSRRLSDAEKKSVVSYLNLKYGLSIPVSDHAYYVPNGYTCDVFGIGRNDDWGLNQTSSASSNADDILEVMNPTGLDHLEYLVFGNNNQSVTLSSVTGNCEAGLALARKWHCDMTGTINSVTLKFDLTGTGITPENGRLLIDHDGDGFSDEMAIAGIEANGALVFENLELEDGDVFSLAKTTTTIYAVANGNSSASIWSFSPGGSAVSIAASCDDYDVVIPSGFSVTLNRSLSCRNLIIESAGTLSTGIYALQIKGNMTVNGTFNCGTSEVSFESLSDQEISGSQAIAFYDLVTINPGVITINAQEVQIRRQLDVTTGTLVTSDRLTILSNASDQGGIGPLTNGSISGKVTIQRYHSPIINGWFNLGAPVSGVTVADWNDDLITTGFPGSDYPSYGMNNITWYNETRSGNVNSGFTGVTTLGNSISDNYGFYVYHSSGPLNIDVTGAIYQGDVSLPVTYTQTGNTTADGWNLVSNPYASTIDWDSPDWVKSNISNALYVWNAPLRQYSAYINGTGTNGGSRYIASCQSFFVVANGINPLLKASESIKSSQRGVFRSEETTPFSLILTLNTPMGSDQTSLRSDVAESPDFDEDLEAMKLFSPETAVPSLGTIDHSGHIYAIQSIGRGSDEIVIPLHIQSPETGRGMLSWEQIPSDFASGKELILENIMSGYQVNMRKQQTAYLFLNGSHQPEVGWRIRMIPNAYSIPMHEMNATASIQEGRVVVLFNLSQPEECQVRAWNMVGQEIATPVRSTFMQDQLILNTAGKVSSGIIEIIHLKSGLKTILKVAGV